MSREQRLEIVDSHPVRHQQVQPVLTAQGNISGDVAVSKLIDQKYLATPFHGSRRMTVWLKDKPKPETAPLGVFGHA